MRRYPELFESVNRGKRSIMLDLKDPDGRARALELGRSADVVVEGFRPGVLARLGMDEPVIRAVNPPVVYCSISGYGQAGPLSRLPGHDINYQAWAGALAPEGGGASMPPLPLADLASGMTAAFGICAALVGREAGGSGAYLDISMTDVMATWTGSAGSASDADPGGGDGGDDGNGGDGGDGGDDAGHEADGDRDGDNHRKAVEGPPNAAAAVAPGVPGYGLFGTADGGQVALGVVNEQHFWSALCTELGLHAVAGLSFVERLSRGDELSEAVASAVRTRPRDDLVSTLLGAGVPVAPVLDRRGMLARAPFPMFPIRPGEHLELASIEVAPTLDQHRGEGFRRTSRG